MAQRKIDISKGLFENVDGFEIGNEAFAPVFKNALITEAGTNVGRPGFSAFSNTENGYAIQGLYFFKDYLVGIDTNRQIWKMNSSGDVVEVTGSLLGANARPVFAEDGTYLAVAGGGVPQRWDGGIGNFELMPGSPESCTHISYLDGYWIIHLLLDQEFRIAGPTSATRETWNSSDYFQAEGLPDKTISQATLIRELYSFGERSIEIFQNYGDAITPFGRTFFIDLGCGAPYSVIQADNTLWWLSHDRRIMKMNGRTPQLVSSPIDRTLKSLGTVSDCWASRIDIGGFYLLAWTFPTEERTFVYDYQKDYWSEWIGYRNQVEDRLKMHSYCYADSWNRHFVGDPTTGAVLEMKMTDYDDNGYSRRFHRETAHITHGTDARKRHNHYLFNIKTGVGTLGATEPVFIIQVNDDDKGWSDERWIPLGIVGSENTVLRVRVPGIYRRRRIRIVCTDAVDFRLNSIEENFDLMVS
jgi:hypothetical protein